MHEYSYDIGKSKTPFIEVVGVRCQGNNETHSITDYSSTSIRPTMIIGPSIISMTTPTLTDSLHMHEGSGSTGSGQCHDSYRSNNHNYINYSTCGNDLQEATKAANSNSPAAA
jgi:hypothetical protein